MSYGLSARVLAEVLPLWRALDASAVRHHAQAVAQRLEDELGPEEVAFIDGCQDEWDRSRGRTCPWSWAWTAASCSRPTEPGRVKLLKAVAELDGYIRANARSIPNYAERYLAGEPISSALSSPPSTR